MSRTNITSTIISTDYSKGGTGNSKIGGTGRFFQGGGGGTRNGSNKENERNNKMGGKERVQKTSTATFSNMSTVGGTMASPTVGRDGPLNSSSNGANNIRSTSSTKPCCFCWCCCCSCSW